MAATHLKYSNRELAQIKAALIFWRNSAKYSRTHPAENPFVSALFIAEKELTIDELTALIEGIPHDYSDFATPLELGNRYNVTPSHIRSLVKAYQVKPAAERGSRTAFYNIRDFDALMESLK